MTTFFAFHFMTFCHETQGHFSYIDYIFVSRDIAAELEEFKVLDLAYNFSDHLPIYAKLSLPIHTVITMNKPAVPKIVQRKRRWDHAVLPLYYDYTRELLQPIYNQLLSQYQDWSTDNSAAIGDTCCNYELSYAFNKVNNSAAMNSNVNRDYITRQLNILYDQVTESLCLAADTCIPQIEENYFKFWWNEEMSILKSNSCSSHRDWLAAGRPGSGPIYDAKRVAKALYRKCIRNHKIMETRAVSNSLHDALLNKSQSNFWSIWKKKICNKNSSPSVIEGLSDDQCIVDGFSKYFSNICQDESNDISLSFAQQFHNKFSSYHNELDVDLMNINVEFIDKIVRSLKKGKAAGVDGLTAEHIQYSHPIIVSILNLFFKLFIKFEHVPPSFSLGIIIPIPKNDSKSNFDKFSEYRGITISPVISKFFEHCILDNIKQYLVTSDLQFGFKKGLGCNHAIYTVREVVSYFTKNNSTVNLCALDVSKAFDRVNYFSLFSKLIDRNIPRNIITLLFGWFSTTVAMVRWNACMSSTVKILSGVRQGGILSPFLFAVFVDDVLVKLRTSA